MDQVEKKHLVLRWKKTAVKVIDSRLYRVPRIGPGPFYTRGEIAEYLGIPPNVATEWIRNHKQLGEKQLSILRNRQRPEGFIQREGNEVATTRERLSSEIARAAEEAISVGKKVSQSEIQEIALATCLREHPSWTRRYLLECMYFLHEENPKVREKKERPWVTRSKRDQRRKYITRIK